MRGEGRGGEGRGGEGEGRELVEENCIPVRWWNHFRYCSTERGEDGGDMRSDEERNGRPEGLT